VHLSLHRLFLRYFSGLFRQFFGRTVRAQKPNFVDSGAKIWVVSKDFSSDLRELAEQKKGCFS